MGFNIRLSFQNYKPGAIRTYYTIAMHYDLYLCPHKK